MEKIGAESERGECWKGLQLEGVTKTSHGMDSAVRWGKSGAKVTTKDQMPSWTLAKKDNIEMYTQLICTKVLPFTMLIIENV